MRTVDGRVPLPTKPGLGFELSEAALRKYPFGGTKAMEFGWHGIRGQQVPPLRYPGFPVDFGGVGALHAPFFTEGRARGLV
jgi:hypothetical protein